MTDSTNPEMGMKCVSCCHLNYPLKLS